MGYRWTSDIFQFKSTKIVGKGSRLPRSENGVIIKRFTHTHTHLMPAPRNHTFFIPWFFKGRVLLSLYVCGERGSHHINRRLPKKEPFLQNCGQSIGYGWSVILYRVPRFNTSTCLKFSKYEFNSVYEKGPQHKKLRETFAMMWESNSGFIFVQHLRGFRPVVPFGILLFIHASTNATADH